MKYLVILLLIIALYHSISFSQSKAESTKTITFQGFDFGTSKNLILSKYKKQIKAGNDGDLSFSGNVINLDCEILFSFYQNKLCAGYYLFTVKHSNQNLYINDYKKIADAITEKYGKPTRDDEDWSDELYKDDPSHYGFAVSLGHLTYFSSWHDHKGNLIYLNLSGDNYTVNLGVIYRDNIYYPQQKAEEKNDF